MNNERRISINNNNDIDLLKSENSFRKYIKIIVNKIKYLTDQNLITGSVLIFKVEICPNKITKNIITKIPSKTKKFFVLFCEIFLTL